MWKSDQKLLEVSMLPWAISNHSAKGKCNKINWNLIASVEDWPDGLPSSAPEPTLCQATSGHHFSNVLSWCALVDSLQLIWVLNITLSVMLLDSCQFLGKPK